MTGHRTMESHRLTVRNTLVLTTKRLDYVYGADPPSMRFTLVQSLPR